ncbi:hypothetical protein AAG906_014873 [Vitis piasezkii]
MGSGEKWIGWIMLCISRVRLFMLVSRTPSGMISVGIYVGRLRKMLFKLNSFSCTAGSCHLGIRREILNQLGAEKRDGLKRGFSEEKVLAKLGKLAGDRVPGPDGFH